MSAETNEPAVEPMTRRTLLRRTGAAAAGTAAVGAGAHRAGLSPVGGANAIACGGLCIGAAAAGAGLAVGAGVGYLAGSNSGSGVSEEEVNNALAAEDHLELYNRAREAHEVREENVLSSMETEANTLRGVARENAVFAIFEQAASGLSRSDCETAAIEEIDAVYTTPQERLITRMNGYVNSDIYVTGAQDLSVLMVANEGANFTNRTTSTAEFDISLVDGSRVTGEGYSSSSESLKFWEDGQVGPDSGKKNELWIDTFDPASYDQNPDDYDMSTVDGRQQFLDWVDYRSVWTKLVDEHAAMIDEVQALLDTHYEAISSGEANMQEFLAPGSMIDTASEATTWREAALLLDSMGLPKATEPAILNFDVSEYDAIDGDVAEFEGMLGWSLADQSDSGFPVGQQIDPANYPGNIYFATQWEDQETGEMDADVLELVAPFTIAGTQNGSSELTFESRDVVQPDTSPEEAMNIFRENRESEQQARETTVEVIVPDDGGGFSLDFLPSFGLPTPGGVPIWAWGAGAVYAGKKLLDSN